MFEFLKKLEDPVRPLLGPNVKALKFWGLLLPEKSLMRYIYFLLHIILIVFIATEYIDIWFVRGNISLVLNNFKITMSATLSAFKGLTFLYWQKHWLIVIDYATRADLANRATIDAKKNKIINGFTTYCRLTTYIYWFLTYVTVFVIVTIPLKEMLSSASYRMSVKNGTNKYIETASSWVPLDKTTLAGYLTASLYQSCACVYGAGWITSFDSNVISLMVFFRAEIELLKIDCSNIFGTLISPVSDDVALNRLKECHRRQVDLLTYSRLLDSCLSPIMLFYVFVCSFMLCATAIQITSDTSTMERIMVTVFLLFGISQLFMYCWHSNDVYFASMDLYVGPYESFWWFRGVHFKRNIAMLMAQFSKTIVFTAGPFTNLNVPTFIVILKGAYSYYTLLNSSQIT